MNISFTVPGEPVGKARARAGNGHHYTPQKTRDYETGVKMAAAHAMAGRPMMQGPIWVGVVAYLRPSKAIGKILAKGGDIAALKKPDLDNIAKSILDAMNGIVYADDCNVVSLCIAKKYAFGDDEVGVEVAVEPCR